MTAKKYSGHVTGDQLNSLRERAKKFEEHSNARARASTMDSESTQSSERRGRAMTELAHEELNRVVTNESVFNLAETGWGVPQSQSIDDTSDEEDQSPLARGASADSLDSIPKDAESTDEVKGEEKKVRVNSDASVKSVEDMYGRLEDSFGQEADSTDVFGSAESGWGDVSKSKPLQSSSSSSRKAQDASSRPRARTEQTGLSHSLWGTSQSGWGQSQLEALTEEDESEAQASRSPTRVLSWPPRRSSTISNGGYVVETKSALKTRPSIRKSVTFNEQLLDLTPKAALSDGDEPDLDSPACRLPGGSSPTGKAGESEPSLSDRSSPAGKEGESETSVIP